MRGFLMAVLALFGFSVALPFTAKADLVTYNIAFTASDFDNNPDTGIEVTGAFSITLDPTQSYGCGGGCEPSSAIIESVSYWNVTTSTGTSTFAGIDNYWFYAPVGSPNGSELQTSTVLLSGDAEFGSPALFPAVNTYLTLDAADLNTSSGSCASGEGVGVLFGTWEYSGSCSFTISATDDTSIPEPTTMALLLSGMAGLRLIRRPRE